MEEGYVVRALVYVGSDGRLTRELGKAQLFKDLELAECSADLASGWVLPVVRTPKNQPKKPFKPIKENSLKSNQEWMRKL